MEIRETQIEDILISSPTLMQETLRLEEEPRLIGRQIVVSSGRLDMLYAYQKDLFLFQSQGKLVQGYIQHFLLLPEISNSNKKIAESEGVLCEEYNPKTILKYFYSKKLCLTTSFVEKQVNGYWHLEYPLDKQINLFVG